MFFLIYFMRIFLFMDGCKKKRMQIASKLKSYKNIKILAIASCLKWQLDSNHQQQSFSWSCRFLVTKLIFTTTGTLIKGRRVAILTNHVIIRNQARKMKVTKKPSLYKLFYSFLFLYSFWKKDSSYLKSWTGIGIRKIHSCEEKRENSPF